MKKEFRIRKNEEFQKIIQFKRFYASPSLTLYVKPKNDTHARVGISVGKKIGGAVQRNKVKRQLRMMLQECFDFDGSFDAVVLVRPHFNEENYNTNKNYLETLLKKVKI